MNTELKHAIQQFEIEGKALSAKPFGGGHIHNTFLVNTENGSYCLQQFNHHVFKDPMAVTQNILKVTSHLQEKNHRANGNSPQKTLTPIPTSQGDYLHVSDNEDCWRMFEWIQNTQTLEQTQNKQQYRNAAKTYGQFLCLLADFPAGSLHTTIPDFHHTPKRFQALVNAIEEDPASRARQVSKDIDFALAREEDTHILVDLLDAGLIPERVTHNDTKLNNVLFDVESEEAVCVIDLDTVMPGSALYDFGDCVRSCATKAAEDEKNLELVQIDLEVFELLAQGFLEATKDILTPLEVEHLAFSGRLITFEIGIRFLTDYLQGDTYFKTEYPEHNLVRARNQFKLVQHMEDQFHVMQSIAGRLWGTLLKCKP